MSLDLNACAAEPIRIPGAIQPHGWLVVIEKASANIIAYSTNCMALTGLAAGHAQTAALRELVDPLLPAILPLAAGLAPVSIGAASIGRYQLDATCHCVDSLALLEFEPVPVRSGAQQAPHSFTSGFVDGLRHATTTHALVALAAGEMKRITGFGRCLIYCFDAEGHGNVLAEERDAGYDSYLGHSFPASDIPSQARELYLRNHIRVIPDVQYTPVLFHFAETGWKTRTVDLTFAQLRSVSPVHLEYMRNMNTMASMSVSIIVRGRLWGLVSCHDHAPQVLDRPTRLLCEHLGQLLSLLLEAREDNIEIAHRLEQRGSTMRIVSHLGDSDATLRDLVEEPRLLLELTGASGAAVVFNDSCWTVGATPAPERLAALADWVQCKGVDVFHTDRLAGTDAPLLPVPARAAGLLAICLSRDSRHALLWFRPELVRSVRWAGEPPKILDEHGKLHPRRSFHSWEEIVRGHSSPWTASEVAGATELRSSLLDIVMPRVQERLEATSTLRGLIIAKEAAEQADSAKTRFLAVLSHELRTPLASIAYAARLLGRNSSIAAPFADLIPMIQRNVAIESRLVDDLLDMSAISAGKLHLEFEAVDMIAMVAQVVQVLAGDVTAKSLRLQVDAGTGPVMVRADPVRMQQALWNILRNAIKFTPPGGLIEVTGLLREGVFVLTFKDSGVGIEASVIDTIFTAFEQGDARTNQQFGGLGLGLAIAAYIVHGHQGTLAAFSDGVGLGATFVVSVPAPQQVAVHPGKLH